MPPITNVAAYKFATLENLKPLRERLLARCKSRRLKGTILLSTEGINLFLAGGAEQIDTLLAELRTIPGLEDLTGKYSESNEQPFRRMLVKIKREIIAFGMPEIDPARRPAPRITPQQLKQWLDEGRPITLLDTRNDYEVKLGTFRNAVVPQIDHFRDFPQAVVQLPESLKRQPIVTFCTGGIRCEKAAPYLQSVGFENVYQLDGGILKYFEECGSAHYEGECFVFDQRVGLDPSLAETASDQCFACQSPLTQEDQNDERFVKGMSCPYCHRSSQRQHEQTIATRHQAIKAASTPLPGSQPYNNYRPLRVPQTHHGGCLIDLLTTIFPYISRDQWQATCAAGLIASQNKVPVPAEHIVHAGELYFHLFPSTIEPEVNADIQILHEDEAIILVNKPAPLPVHACGRFNRNTLEYLLNIVYHPNKPRPVHRLDANTTGIMLLARTRHFAKLLQSQLARCEMSKVYLALVQGHPPEDDFVCTASISAQTTELGARSVEEQGLTARTDFKVIERFANGTTLIEARPATGRTNQIRVHLWNLGYPICGDQTYLRGETLGDTQTHHPDDPPLCLHAHELAFFHPVRKEQVTFTAPLPSWLVERELPAAAYAAARRC